VKHGAYGLDVPERTGAKPRRRRIATRGDSAGAARCSLQRAPDRVIAGRNRPCASQVGRLEASVHSESSRRSGGVPTRLRRLHGGGGPRRHAKNATAIWAS